jgi:hypothetical protein
MSSHQIGMAREAALPGATSLADRPPRLWPAWLSLRDAQLAVLHFPDEQLVERDTTLKTGQEVIQLSAVGAL